MAKWKISDDEFERQHSEAVKRGAEREKTEPQALVVSYDRPTNELAIRLKNGASFTVPIDLLEEFRGATPADIAEVEVRPRGATLHWEKLDQDFTVGGLIASVFGDEVLMAEMGRKGGSVQSEAKAVASRENGLKGGRPTRPTIMRVVVPSQSLGQVLTEPNSVEYRPKMTGVSRSAVNYLATCEAILTRSAISWSSPITSALLAPIMGRNSISLPDSTAIYQAQAFGSVFKVAQIKEAKDNDELALAA